MKQPQITITFASDADQAEAWKQIAKAREYAYRDRQLGALGLAMLLKTLERAKSITCHHQTQNTKEQKTS